MSGRLTDVIGVRLSYSGPQTLAEPLSMSPQKALEHVGNQLQKQYERWQPRARYKQLLDPTTEDVRKLCVALRKNAKVSHLILYQPSW